MIAEEEKRFDLVIRLEEDDLDTALIEGCMMRLRPVMMTALVATFGLLPAALFHEIGSDSQRPLAIVVVGGLLSSLILSLFTLPALYKLYYTKIIHRLQLTKTCDLSMLVLSLCTPCSLYASTEAQKDNNLHTLEDIYTLFQQHNLALVAAKHDLLLARANTISAAVYPNPTFTANGLFLAHGTNANGEKSLNFIYDQVIPLAGQVSLRKRVSLKLENAAEAECAHTLFNLYMDLKIRFIRLQWANAKMRLAKEEAEEFKQLSDVIDKRTLAGANPQYDRMRSEVALRKKWYS